MQFKGTVYENGYGLIAKKVMVDTELSLQAKAIYSYLVSYAWGKDKVYPTIKTMLYHLGIAENTFLKHRKGLVDRGYITIETTRQGSKNRNIYTINSLPQNLRVSKSEALNISCPQNLGGKEKKSLQEKKFKQDNNKSSVFLQELSMKLRQKNLSVDPQKLLTAAKDVKTAIQYIDWYADKGPGYLISAIKGAYGEPAKIEDKTTKKSKKIADDLYKAVGL
jgi:hypothetical protein